MRKGQSDEVEVELQLSQVRRLIVFWIEFVIFVHHAIHLLCQDWLFV